MVLNFIIGALRNKMLKQENTSTFGVCVTEVVAVLAHLQLGFRRICSMARKLGHDAV